MKKLSIVLLIWAILPSFMFKEATSQEAYYHLNKVIAKLERNVLVTGIWVKALHPSNAIGLVELNGYPSYEESLTTPMIDFILIDMEHEPFEMTELRNFLLALNSKREVSLAPAHWARIREAGHTPWVFPFGATGGRCNHSNANGYASSISRQCQGGGPPGGLRHESAATWPSLENVRP